ncbi:DUF1287 domain-containing protein [Bacillus sp. B-jedd]|uniref:DUF1287 domain-containing protein n=1 Tax=Bacillus sp. B-jedd TaxID=1476857 RepID=UPI00051565B8|nr:DUF1287 domain-containing protein [Bacillus sp. B-jedd]CEG26975.1 hypothetical protein BN1002_01830 [Bacillus sp. B-jedd]
MKLKKILLIICVVLVVGVPLFSILFRDGLILDMAGVHLDSLFTKKVIVEEKYIRVDKNQNNVADPLDVVNAARKEVENRTPYKSAYYEGGYPPDSEGVCTDVIWRGLAGAGINLKDLMDQDIKENTSLYPRVEGNPDPHIDFRRVPNQYVFFQRFAESLTTELIPNDPDNLAEWQPGDIVIYLDGTDHAGIISNKRTKDGIPYLIHNIPPFASEIKLTSYQHPIAGHYRWNY